MLDAARDLYCLPPAEFTAARNRLAKELKAAGDASDAQLVGGLRRPRVAEFALNRLARDDRATVEALAAAIADAQRAQSAAIGGDARALREATNDLRRASAAVVDAAVRGLNAGGGNGEAQRDDLVALLREFIGGADVAPLIAGVVGSTALVASAEFFPGAPDPPLEPGKRSPSRPPAPEKPASEKGMGAAKRAMERAERTRLEDNLRVATAAVASATAAVDAAQAALADRRAALKSAQAAMKAAAKELDANPVHLATPDVAN